MRNLSVGLLLLLVPITNLFAHGPTRQQVTESVSIDAPPQQVWAMVGNFSALHEWHPAIASTEMQDDKTRILSLAQGGTITEELKQIDDAKMMLKYRIAEMSTVETFEFAGKPLERKVLPVNTYSATLSVAAGDTGSTVTWKGKFYRGYLLNPPTPEGMSDKDAVDAITAVYRAGLDNLKSMLEKP
ncbi:MAG: SRPBCC family protein [Gammaproteobacteria bacterium]|nr:SRPBCC family protein [Gammaproteobacteria bacterium]